MCPAYAPIVALDNLAGAADVYFFTIPGGPRPALVVGNERRGVTGEVLAMATSAVQIPMLSQRLNCLNVAAAAAIALYYLSRGGSGKRRTTAHPDQRRPELLYVGPIGVEYR